ncbi:unnamed protein product [Hymenolepis diminuta]|uniref:Sporozoite surface protein 2-like n=1 Tax=Hymenolepis diminuta TaxID=6216 RepID=A0A0R3SJN0_HYMDI|nr:unnamed protein product [Hymenolepis diminuta]
MKDSDGDAEFAKSFVQITDIKIEKILKLIVGIIDLLDTDDDNDGIPDYLDNDDDGDGIPDDKEDFDEDGIPDLKEKTRPPGKIPPPPSKIVKPNIAKPPSMTKPMKPVIDPTTSASPVKPEPVEVLIQSSKLIPKTGRKLRKARHDDGDNLDEEEEELDFIHLPTIRANIRITLHTEKHPAKKRVDDNEVKSVFGKAPQPKRKASAFEDDEDDKPTMLRQIVQGVLRHMEAIFGVEE